MTYSACPVTHIETARKRPLHARIKWARERKGFSQEVFAAAVGTSRRHVMRWENSKGHAVKPGAEFLARIAEVTGQRPAFFIDDEDDEESSPATMDLARALQAMVAEARQQGRREAMEEITAVTLEAEKVLA